MRDFFPRLCKNEKIKKRLGRLIETGKLSHAFLITGPSGIGKRTLAIEIAAALNCENKDNLNMPLPCGRCNTCKRIYGGNFTDITYVKRHGSSLSIGVEEIRELRNEIYLAPNESDYKIFIFEEADRLTQNSQNALLKVLEEPPGSAVMLLLTDAPDKILTTIKSRTQIISPERLSEEELYSYVTSHVDYARSLSISNKEMLSGIVMSAEGRIGSALSLLSEKNAKENGEQRQATMDIIKALRPSTPYTELYKALSAIPTSRNEIAPAVESVILALRDLILIKNAPEAPLAFYTSRGEATELSDSITTKRLLQIYDIFNSVLADNQKNVGIGTMITDIGAKIKLI